MNQQSGMATNNVVNFFELRCKLKIGLDELSNLKINTQNPFSFRFVEAVQVTLIVVELNSSMYVKLWSPELLYIVLNHSQPSWI